MTYATQQDLIDRFTEEELVQLTDNTASGEIDPAPVATALADADAEIEAALVGRYALPMAPVPELLTRIACDLARESLYADQPTDVVKDRAKRGRELLLQIARGAMRLGADAAPAEDSSQGLVEIVSGRTKSPFTGQ